MRKGIIINVRKKIILYSIIALSNIQILSCCSNDKSFSEDEWRRKADSADKNLLYTAHFNNGVYYNPWMPKEEHSFFTVLKWKLFSNTAYTEYEERYLPEIIPNAKERIQSINNDFILWIGHGTFLIRIDEEYWLTDPIFSERALLPKRKTPPGILLDDIKQITNKINVIITHNHYDHLDKDSIIKLPKETRYFVPMGLKEYIEEWGIEYVFEMDWWQSTDTSNELKLICLPAQHWSKRINQSVNKSLWASFLLITPSIKLYFAGDSGYFIGYKEIGNKYPGIDYAFIPTTAYHPRWFMHSSHMNIEEATDAFNDLGARFFIPTQWGTFQLGDEPPGYPSLNLQRKINEMKLDKSRFIIMNIGEIILIDKEKKR